MLGSFLVDWHFQHWSKATLSRRFNCRTSEQPITISPVASFIFFTVLPYVHDVPVFHSYLISIWMFHLPNSRLHQCLTSTNTFLVSQCWCFECWYLILGNWCIQLWKFKFMQLHFLPAFKSDFISYCIECT